MGPLTARLLCLPLLPLQAAATGPAPARGFEYYWTYRLLEIDGQPITVRKIVIGTGLLLMGFVASRGLSRLTRRRFFPRLRLSEGAAAAFETGLFYLLLLVFGLTGLAVAGVPLAAFTLLGGAAAIGVGFGSQTVIGNFISGLILLVERPINVGNLIQVGDLFVTVERIGARSTRVKTGENVELIVPNSAFLDQNVINWTLSESRVRIKVTVGVVYGSPTREVERLIRQAVDEHDRIHDKPEPIVLFTEFGDNSLNFEVHFWIEMRSVMERRRITSDVRYRIDELFRKADIVIAFPQRDVHLDTVKPLEVRVTQG